MKRSVCCLLLGCFILCLPAQEALAAPVAPKVQTAEKKEEDKKLQEKEKPHEKEHEKPLPPHEKKKPKEKKKPHEVKLPHEEKKGPLAEKPVPPVAVEKPKLPHEKKEEAQQPEVIPAATPTAKPTAMPTIAPTVIPSDKNEDMPEYPEASSLRQQIVEYALKFVGAPYKYGGTSLTNGIDCSGFTQAIYAKFGYGLSRTSRTQAASTEYKEVAVKESELLPGDLIYYANTNKVVYHVAIYIGDGKVVHASNTKKRVAIADYSYYNMKPYIARRIIE